MATTRNFAAIILVMIAALILALGLTIARIIVSHTAVATTSSVSAASATQDIVHDF